MQNIKVIKKLGLTLVSMLCIILIASFIGNTKEEDIEGQKITQEDISKEKDAIPDDENSALISTMDNQKDGDSKTLSDNLKVNNPVLQEQVDRIKNDNLSEQVLPYKVVDDALINSDTVEALGNNNTEVTSNKDVAKDEESSADKEESKTEESLKVEDDSTEEIIEALNIKNPQIDIDASNAILMNCNTKEVLYYKNPTDSIAPASTTKLLTAIVAIDNCDLDEEITVGKEVYMMASDSSRAYLAEGEVLTLEMLLEGLLLPSGNDAAYVIAAHVGRIIANDNNLKPKAAVQVFIQSMNEKAKAIGAKSSNFETPDGYDEEGQYTTAYDLGLIAMESLKYDTIREISSKTRARNIFLSGEDVTWNSSNKLITSGSGYYYPYAIGLKTGTSTDAGRCLVSAASKDGVDYVCVIMNSSIEGRWQDSIDVLKYGVEGS